MSNRRKALVIALLLEMQKVDSWCGETHIQKTMYALDSLLKTPTDFEFILYRHGPYSFDLHDELLSMAASELLEIEQRYPYGPSLRPTESGEKLLSQFPKMKKRLDSRISFIAEQLSNGDVASLEKYATAIFVTDQNTEDVEERAEQVVSLKPHISVQEAREAVSRVDKIINIAKNRHLLDD